MQTTLERELSIISRVVAPKDGKLSPGAANAILEMGFCDDDRNRFAELVELANSRQLTDEEKSEVETFSHVEHWLIKMKSRARKSLN